MGVDTRVGARVAGIVVRPACAKVVADGDGVRVAEGVGDGMKAVADAVGCGVSVALGVGVGTGEGSDANDPQAMLTAPSNASANT